MTPEARASQTRARLLDETADYLETYGWVQGAYTEGNSGEASHADIARYAREYKPACCMVGAVIAVAGPVSATAAVRILYSEFEKQVTTYKRGILNFNDEEGRTKEEIIATLRRMAAQCRN